MSGVRAPASLLSPGSSAEALSDHLFDALGHEVLAEKAAALGRAGDAAAKALEHLQAIDRDHPERPDRLKSAADAVYAYFIQRELVGLRRHDTIIRDLCIPGAVLARLGAK